MDNHPLRGTERGSAYPFPADESYVEAIEGERITAPESPGETLLHASPSETDGWIVTRQQEAPFITPNGFAIYNSERFTAASITRYTEGFRSRRDAAQFEGASPLTAKDQQLIEIINDALTALGDEVGIDVRPRRLDASHVHIFAGGTAYRQALHDRKMHSEENGGGLYSPELGVMWRRQSPAVDRAGLAHEIGHHYEMKHVRLVVQDGNKRLRVGSDYGVTHKPGAQSVSAEWRADLLMARALQIAGFKTNVIYPYNEKDLLLSELIEATAHTHGCPPFDIERLVIRDVLGGSIEGLIAMNDHLKSIGRGAAMDAFLGDSLPARRSINYSLMHSMGLPPTKIMAAFAEGYTNRMRLGYEDAFQPRAYLPFDWPTPFS